MIVTLPLVVGGIRFRLRGLLFFISYDRCEDGLPSIHMCRQNRYALVNLVLHLEYSQFAQGVQQCR